MCLDINIQMGTALIRRFRSGSSVEACWKAMNFWLVTSRGNSPRASLASFRPRRPTTTDDDRDSQYNRTAALARNATELDTVEPIERQLGSIGA